MSVRKTKSKYSYHGRKRYSQRYEGHDRINVLIQRVVHYGLCIRQLPQDSKLRHFLETKEAKKRKKVKVLDGYVFILFTTSNRLITMYPIPEEFAEEYDIFKSIEHENKFHYKTRVKNNNKR